MSDLEKIPFVAFGNDELAQLPLLRAGQRIRCPHCGKEHVTTAARSTTGELVDGLAFYQCGKASYLASVSGHAVFGAEPSEEGAS